MKYCTRCLYPDSKPDLTFNTEGVCSACQAFSSRKLIDWRHRENQFKEMCELAKNAVDVEQQPYHCIVPVSGGKDSHYQVIKVIEYGLNPLAVTAITDDLSTLGNYNMHNIAKLGCDHVFVSTNAKLRRSINKYTLETVGDISWAEHVTIFTIPIREAITRDIPLIIYGENPQNEYGGPNEESQKTTKMTKKWLDEFGGLNGLRPKDIVDAGIAKDHEMFQYNMPRHKGSIVYPNSVFLGQFFEWDGWENAITASEHGFVVNATPVETSGMTYENLDNHQTGIHDRFKYLKFGFGRATDMSSNLIRRGIITREEGIEHVLEWDGKEPTTYLDKPLQEILDPLGLLMDDYISIENKFANPDLFEIKEGTWPRPKFKVR